MNRIFIFLLKAYQITISPYLGPCCRFTPTCSEYGIQALQKYGFFKACWLTIKRLAKCHPYSSHHGFDPP